MASVGAALLPRLDGNQDVVLSQVALHQRDANQAVLQLTGGKVARAAVGAAVAVSDRAWAAKLVDLAVWTLVVWLALSRAGAVGARKVLRDKLWSALAWALAGLAQEHRAVLALLGDVDLDHAALVQLRAADRARLADPALWVALGVARVAADRAEHKLEAVVEAGALALQDNNRLDQSAAFDLEWRARRGVKQWQRHKLATRRQQIARHAQAGHRFRGAEAVAALDNLARLKHTESAILQDVAQFVGKFPSVVRKFREACCHSNRYSLIRIFGEDEVNV